MIAGVRQDQKSNDKHDCDNQEHFDPARPRGGLGPPIAGLGTHMSLLLQSGIRGPSLRDTLSMSSLLVCDATTSILRTMPKLWSETIEEHRRTVREAILDTTVALVSEHGLLSVTMSQIADETGIGRATLYKYFPAVEAILLAWHERQIAGHFQYLREVRDEAGAAGERLAAVLEAYALILHQSHQHHDTELAAFLHRDEQVSRAQQRLKDMIGDLLTEGAAAGEVRNDVAPHELASYSMHALTAARYLPSKAAVRRLVTVTMAGLQPLNSTPI
jgi:AcrR family transcriptional regulator